MKWVFQNRGCRRSLVAILTLAVVGCAGPTTVRTVDVVATVVPALVHCDGHFVPSNASAKWLLETLQPLMGGEGPFSDDRLTVVGPPERPGICIQVAMSEPTSKALLARVIDFLRQLDRVPRKRRLQVNVWDVVSGTLAWHRTVLLAVNGEGFIHAIGPTIGWNGRPFYIKFRISNPHPIFAVSDGDKADDVITARWSFEDPAKYSHHPTNKPRSVRRTVLCEGEPLTMALTEGPRSIFTLVIEVSESTKLP